MSNLALILDNSAKRHPKKVAFIFENQAYTYSDIYNLANRIANALEKIGIRKGENVAISCTNSYIFPAIFFGVLKMGAVIVPLNFLLKQNEIAFQLQNSDSRLYFCYTPPSESPSGTEGFQAFRRSPGCQYFISIGGAEIDSSTEGPIGLEQFLDGSSHAYETMETNADDTAAIIYSSGTTGKPKGAELTHRGLLESAQATIACLGMHDRDISLLVLPMFHIFGMSVCLNTAVLLGMTTVILSKFHPEEFLKCLIKYSVTIFGGVPTIYWNLLNYKGDVSVQDVSKHLRMCISGGAPLPLKLLTDFEARFGVSILEGYGMTEGSGAVSVNPSVKVRKPGASGLPLHGIDIVILDENQVELPPGERGELCFRGAVVMKGYYNNPQATQQAIYKGWMHSGDVAFKDDDGYIYIVDRTKDMIIRSGFKVYPREIEEVMMSHEDISMVAVVGVPHDQLGEEIKAYVVLKSANCLDPTALMEWAGQHLAYYKVPRLIEFVDCLPLGPTGKVLKRELRTRAQTLD